MHSSEPALKDLCELIVDCPHSTPKWTDSGYLVIRNQNIKNGRLNLDSPSFTDAENFAHRTRRAKPKGGDIVLTREAPMGEVCMIPDGLECCVGQRQVLLRPDNKLVDGKFLFYALQSPFVQNQINWSEGTGSTVSNLRIPHLEALKIKLPGRVQQVEASEILSSIDEQILLLTKNIGTLEAICLAVYKSWFIDFEPVVLKQKGLDLGLINEGLEDYFPSSLIKSNIGLIPDSWECVKATELFKFKKGCEPGTKNYLNISSDDTASFIRVGDLSKRQSDIFVNKSSYLNSYVSREDILLTTDGTIGITAYGYTGVISGGIRKVTYLNEGSGFYIFSTLKTKIFQDQLDSFSPSETSIKHAGTALPQICLIKPPKKLIDAFDAFSKPFFEKMLNNQAQIETLTSLRNALLPKLISGEIKVT